MSVGERSPGKTRSALLRILRFTIGGAVVVLTFYFLVTRLIRDWKLIPFDQLHFNILYLIAAYAILFLFHFPLSGLTWRLILRALGTDLPTLRCVAILTVTQLGKYVPGKVWFTLGRMSFAKREGVPEDKSLVSIVIETSFALLSAVLLLAAAVLVVPRGLVPGQIYWLFLLVPLCLVVIAPPVLNGLLRWALPRLKRPVFELRLSYPQLLGLLSLYVLDWVIQGVGCYALINSFYPLTLRQLPVLLAGNATSWMLGYVVLIAPAGLGVREGMYTLILRLVMAPPVAIISALVTRVWVTTSEVAMALACLPLLRRRPAGSKQQPGG